MTSRIQSSGPLPVSTLVRKRQYSQCGSFAFQRQVSQFLESEKELLMDPELVSPHEKSISSLAVDSTMGRFVLAGSTDATVSVYDLSYWGSEGFSRNVKDWASLKSFRPVARSMRVPFGMMTNDDNRALEIPPGHSAAISHVQWYPVDTGAFASYATDGCLLLWDTNRMQPVLSVTPFAESIEEDSSATWGPAHWQPRGDHNLIAAGSWFDSSVKLVDVRSGASSHQLVGHCQGITAVRWSPTIPVVVASGSRDGTIRLWDIRKSGSQSCISVLGRDVSAFHNDSTVVHPPYQADYSHLRKYAALLLKQKKINKKRKLGDGGHMIVAPNNYRQAQGQTGRSHDGHVAAIAFLPGGQSLASVGGGDGELLLWDLRHGPTLLERKFVAPGGFSAATARQRRAVLCVDAEKDTIWVGHKSTIMGFSLEGGSPKQILRGHLNTVTSLDRIRPELTLLSGSSDGMILSWGKPKGALFSARKSVLKEDKDNW